MVMNIEQRDEEVVVVNDDSKEDNAGENQPDDSDEQVDDTTVEDESDKKNQSKNSKVKNEEDMSQEELDAQKENEDFILNFKEEDMDDEEKRKELTEALKNARTTVHQKRHFRQKLNDYETKNDVKKPAKPSASSSAEKSDNSKELILELRQDNPWMTKEVAQEVVRLAKGYGESISKTVKRPMVADWLRKEKNSKTAEAASIAPNNKGGSGTVGEGIADRDWSNATREEIEKKRNAMMAGR